MGASRLIGRTALLVRRDHTLGVFMDRLGAAYGDRPLVDEAGRDLRLSYAQAAKRVRRWAGGVAREIVVGDRVVVANRNGYEQFLLSLAVARAGGIAVPVNDRMRPEEIDHVVADADARLVIRSVAEVDRGKPLMDARPASHSDTAALFYTSGTTGRPKGVALSHRALLGAVGQAALWPSALRSDEAVVSLPVAHIMGFMTLLGAAAAGVRVHLLPRFRPVEVLDAIESRRATVFVGVPAMYRMMDEAGAGQRDLRSVRLWISGADVMPAELALRFKTYGALAELPAFGPVGEAAFVEGYGMVELGGGAAAKISPPFTRVGLGESLGVTLPGYRFRVVDDDGEQVGPGSVGELLVTGPGVTNGYWGDVETTAQTITSDGWVRTGDLARRGPFGTALFAGRKKDVIMRGGYSVYALEVEQALEAHPAVTEAAVVGRPDDTLGEVPVAAVRVAADAEVSPEQLLAFADEHLAAYKVPAEVVIVDDLPRTGTRKVQKQKLLDLF